MSPDSCLTIILHLSIFHQDVFIPFQSHVVPSLADVGAIFLSQDEVKQERACPPEPVYNGASGFLMIWEFLLLSVSIAADGCRDFDTKSDLWKNRKKGFHRQ